MVYWGGSFNPGPSPTPIYKANVYSDCQNMSYLATTFLETKKKKKKKKKMVSIIM